MSKNRQHTLFGLSSLMIILLLASCAPSRFVVPLKRKEYAFSANVGGPIQDKSGTISPIPFSALTYGYGWKKKTTIFGSLHVTALTYGVAQIDAGLVHRLLYNKKSRFGLSGAPVINLMIDRWNYELKFYPELDLNLFWHFRGDPSYSCDCPGEVRTLMYTYIGVSNWFELSQNRDYDEVQSKLWYPNPHFGFNIGGHNLKLNIEFKYLLVGSPNLNSRVEYYNPISNKDAIGAYLTLTKVFAAR